MRQYIVLQRFFAQVLERDLAAGASVFRSDVSTRLIVQNSPDGQNPYSFTLTNFEYVDPKQAAWFDSFILQPGAAALISFVGTLPETVNGGGSGAQGPTGLQGPNGAPGGPQGFTGGSGVQGSAGSNGAAGTPGTQGSTGASGNNGVQGSTGAAGAPGVQGVAGSNGTNGTNGTQGVAGSTGAAGTQGATGSGTQGATGSNGTVGVQGAAGSNGAAGTQGATGAGTQGATGSSGVQGSAGSNGTNGTNGAQGATGTPGVQGSTGSGTQGSAGPQGSTGAQGSGTGPNTTAQYAFGVQIDSSGNPLASGALVNLPSGWTPGTIVNTASDGNVQVNHTVGTYPKWYTAYGFKATGGGNIPANSYHLRVPTGVNELVVPQTTGNPDTTTFYITISGNANDADPSTTVLVEVYF